jgi:hypothetical protein
MLLLPGVKTKEELLSTAAEEEGRADRHPP